MSLIDKVLSRPEFDLEPPVLVDIGSSGALDTQWKPLAKYSTCVAFDPDAREMGYINKESRRYRKLHVCPSIVHATRSDDVEFYLTASPYCSSILPADDRSLSRWNFSWAFKPERRILLPAKTLLETMRELGLEYVDWFKTDSQGTDLRLFKSLGEDRIAKVLVAEFEPGIIDAYKGEDKLCHVLAYMDGQRNFIVTSCRVLGDRYFPAWLYDKYGPTASKVAVPSSVNISPCWAEIMYINTLASGTHSLRQYLLAWVIAMIYKQYGLALALATKAGEQYNDPMLAQMAAEACRKIKWRQTPLWYKVIRFVYLKTKS